MRIARFRAAGLALATLLLAGAGEQPASCSSTPFCDATGDGVCWYADDLPGRGGRGTFADPFRLGDFPASASDCDDRGGLPAQLRPGDVFYLRGGTYPLQLCASAADGAWHKPLLDAQGDGTRQHPIVFRSYDGESATLVRRSGVAPLAGSYGDDHVRFVGLRFEYPRVSPDDDALGRAGRHALVILGADHVAFAYSTVVMFDHPATSGSTDNHDAFYLDGADFAYIGHNRIQGPGNPANPTPAQNCAGVKLYRSRFSVIEDNWFDRVANPVFDKEEGVDNTYRRNLTTASGYAGFNANGNDLPRWSRARIHDNVFDRSILVTFLADGYEVFRNEVRGSELFGANGAVSSRRVYRTTIWDNLVRADGNVNVFTGSAQGQTWDDRAQIFRYLDHNCYVGRDATPRYIFNDPDGTTDIRYLPDARAAGYDLRSAAVAGDGACGPGRYGGSPGPAARALVLDSARYGPGNQSRLACSDGSDDDGDWLVDFPADPDCRSPIGTSEGGGASDVAPQIVSLGGPYVSRGGSDVALDVVVSDPDSVETVSWQVDDRGPCDDAAQRFAPTQLVEDPVLTGLPASDGTCEVRVFVYDDRGRVATATIPITVRAR